MVFEYQAISPKGERVSGKIDAKGRRDAFQQLDLQGLQPLRLNATEETAPEEATDEIVRLSRAQIIFFSEELGDLLDSGMQLESALKILEQRQESTALRNLAARVREQVRDGTSFSKALSSVSSSFGDLFCSLMAVGEMSGTLAPLLQKQSKYLQSMAELQSKVIQNLIYPAFILTAGCALVVIFLTVLVPQLTVLFDQTGTSMPLPGRILIGTTHFLLEYGWILAIVSVLLIIGGAQFIRTTGGRLWWDRFKWSLPIIGPVLQAGFFAQFSYTLANLVQNGIPLLQGLTLMQKSVSNRYVQLRLETVVEAIGDGRPLSRSLESSGVFPPLMTDLVAVGEQTGNLGSSLHKIATRYEKDMIRRIDRIVALIPPVIIFVLALIIGSLVWIILSSIFETISSLRTR